MRTNFDEFLENPQYKPPSELRLLLGKLKIENKLNNIYFSEKKESENISDNVNSWKVNLSYVEKGQLLTGYQETLDIKAKINISFSTIRTLNFYKKVKKVLIIPTKENIEQWQFLLESLLRDVKEDAVKNEKDRNKNKNSNELVSIIKNESDIRNFLNFQDKRSIAIVDTTKKTWSLLSDILAEVKDQCDLLILEDMKEYDKYQKKGNPQTIFESVKCYLTFPNKSEELKKIIPLTSPHNNLCKDKINYFIFVSYAFTTQKIFADNSAIDSEELMIFCKDFLEKFYKGKFKVEIIDHDKRIAKIIISSEDTREIITEINNLAKNDQFYQFNISKEETLCYFAQPQQYNSEKYSLIDLNHPLLEWIKNNQPFKEKSHPLSVCSLNADSNINYLESQLKIKITKGIYHYAIGFCYLENLYDYRKLIYQVKNISEPNFKNTNDSERFIHYAFYKISKFLPNAENRDESEYQRMEEARKSLDKLILQEWQKEIKQEDIKTQKENIYKFEIAQIEQIKLEKMALNDNYTQDIKKSIIEREKLINLADQSINQELLIRQQKERQEQIKTGIISHYNDQKLSVEKERQQKNEPKPELVAFGLIVIE